MANLSGSRILVSGASGLIGTALLPTLRSARAEIVRLRRPNSKSSSNDASVPWNPSEAIPPDAVSGFDVVVHLAGESIAAGRWSEAQKTKIRESRVASTRHLAQALAQAKRRPRVFVGASAVGYYGNRGDEVLTEASAAGSGFLADICRDWEAACSAAVDAGIRTLHLRTGIVLCRGGALAKMLTPFRLGVGGRIGSGGQWMSWIDIDDMVAGILHAIQNEALRGPVNFVAPNPVTNAEFTRCLASVLSRPAIFPLPAFVVKLALGEMGEELLLSSQRVQPGQLLANNYRFRFSELRASLEHILRQ